MKFYSESYFFWQKEVGKFGGKANLIKFNKFIGPSYSIIDYGSGGGFLLAEINTKEKLGIEVNPVARSFASKIGIQSVADINLIQDNWADLVISNHVLEHVHCPLDELKKIYTKVKQDGKIVVVVPYEKRNKFRPNDKNNHLYTWSEMNLGNLFVEAGFSIIEVSEYYHKWMPGYRIIQNLFGWRMFHFLANAYGYFNSNYSQVRIIAQK